MDFYSLTKKILKPVTDSIGYDIAIRKKNIHTHKLINLKPAHKPYGRVLLGLILEPFLLNKDDKISSRHTNEKESQEIAKIFLELGYEADVISKLRSHYIPNKEYTFYVNLRTNFQGISEHLNPDCIKIVHLDISHWLFNNHAALKRSCDLQIRRGRTISSFRYMTENYAIEACDYATMKGNDFTMGTYKYAGKKIYRTNVPTYTTYDWPDDKNYRECRKNFLWFGSDGFVHKGLDLILEVFKNRPDLNLTVCGPIDKDPAFKKEFYNELCKTPNIVTKGWVDVDSQQFRDIVHDNTAIIFPSCAEGSNGGVITCMQAGLIPIVSVQSGVDVGPDYGLTLHDCSVAEIERKIDYISNLDAVSLKKMAEKSWEYARENHTINTFHRQYKNAIIDIIETENQKRVEQIVYNHD
ncbi:MAG: glycosyltransferase [Cyclonatronaceae bacterium]